MKLPREEEERMSHENCYPVVFRELRRGMKALFLIYLPVHSLVHTDGKDLKYVCGVFMGFNKGLLI